MTRMRTWLAAPLLLLSIVGAAGSVQATDTSTSTHVMDWREDAPLRIRTALGITTQLEIDARETLLDYSIGFAQAWDVVRRDHILYLRPRDADGATNLLIRTRERQYLFELNVHQGTWRDLDELRAAGVAYRIVVRIPDAVVATAASPVEQPAHEAQAPRHYGYRMRQTRWSSSESAPLWVADDGQRTWLQFAQRHDRPMPRILGVDPQTGNTYQVNSRNENSLVIVDGVHALMRLRSGVRWMDIRREDP